MATLQKVDHDPFASAPAPDRIAKRPQLQRVDHDPFAGAPSTPAPRMAAKPKAEPDGFGTSLVKGFKRSLPETKSLLYGAGAAVGGAVGAESVRDWGLENYQRVQREEVAPLQGDDTFKGAVTGEDSLGDWAGDVIGNFGGQALQSVAAGLAGAAVGGAATAPTGPGAAAGAAVGAVGGVVARGAVKKLIRDQVENLIESQVKNGVTREVAEAAGKSAMQKKLQQLGGAAVANVGLNVGQEAGISYTGRAEDAAAAGEQLDQGDAARALGAGAVAGVIDTAAEAVGAGRFLTGASNSPRMARRVAAGVAKGAVTEGATEATQGAIERFGAQRDLTSPEAIDDYIENAAAGALGGGVMGGGSGVRAAARPQPRVEPAGDLTRAAAPEVQAVATPAAQEFPDAAPGSLSDAANATPAAQARQAARPRPNAAGREQMGTRAPPAGMEDADAQAHAWQNEQFNNASVEDVANTLQGFLGKNLDTVSAERAATLTGFPLEKVQPALEMLRQRAAAPDPTNTLDPAAYQERRRMFAQQLAAAQEAGDQTAMKRVIAERAAFMEQADAQGHGTARAAEAPAVPWIDRETGEARDPSDTEIEGFIHDQFNQQMSGGRGINSQVVRQALAVSGLPAKRRNPLITKVQADRKKGITSAAVEPAVQVDPQQELERDRDELDQAMEPAATVTQESDDAAAAEPEGGESGAGVQPELRTAEDPAVPVAGRADAGAVPAAQEPAVDDAAAPVRAESIAPAAGTEARAPDAPTSAPELEPAAVYKAAYLKAHGEDRALPESSYAENAAEVMRAIEAKDVDALRGRNLASAEARTAERTFFEQQTGVKLPKGRRASEAALDAWAGVTPEQRAAKTQARNADVAVESARRDVRHAATLAATRQVNTQDEGVVAGDRYIDGLMDRGFSNVVRRGSVTYLANAEGEAFRLPHKHLSAYARARTKANELQPQGAVQAAAAEAATNPANDKPDATPAQREAGNFAVGRMKLAGMDVSVEYPAGVKRKPDHKPLTRPYGYFRRTEGKDGDHVDVFLGDRAEDASLPVFVIDQVDQAGKYDEAKVVMGEPDEAAAREAYLSNYPDGWTGLGGITQLTQDEFKAWVKDPAKTKLRLSKPAPTRRVGGRKIKVASATSNVEEEQAAIDGISSLDQEAVDDLLQEIGDQVQSDVDAQRRWSAGDFLFAAHEMAEGEPALVSSYSMLQSYSPDQLMAVAKNDAPDWLAKRSIDRTKPSSAPAASPPAPQSEVAPKTRVVGGRRVYVPAARETLEAYFQPGREIDSYGGRERVLSFDWNEGNWSVRVQGLTFNGRSIEDESPRSHGTAPDTRALRKVLGDPAQYAQKPKAKKTPVAKKPTPEVSPAKTPVAAKEDPPTGPIEDFGETLHGARKHYAAAYADRMAAAQEVDVAAEPLSTSWPAPDYAKWLEDGVAPDVAAFVHAARDQVPTKPQSAWKLRGWVEQVTLLRDLANQLQGGTITAAEARAKLVGREQWRADVRDRMELYSEVGHEVSLKGIHLRSGAYSIYKGEKHSPAKVMWSVEKKAKATAYSNWPTILGEGETKEAAIAAFKKQLPELEQKKASKGPTKFTIYSYRGRPGFFVGKRIAKAYTDLEHFDTPQEAREYLANNQDKLEAKWATFKDIPEHRRDSNAPRLGVDHRAGGDVGAEQFSETFGFRGVQFGNYVEGDRRQRDLNNAYDALMDMAGVLGVPARALSLNGELGLAFGARGKGGKRAPMAHYEPGHVVINLTKRDGAGSLAHEWWHALDNYFGRQRGDIGYVTNNPAMEPGGMRAEMQQAFVAVMDAISTTGLRERSKELDKRRTKAYWSTDLEMSARSFESYMLAKLADQGAANDYLVNVVSEDAFAIENGYPYLTAAEIPTVRAALDEFFTTVETSEGDGGNVAMYSRRGWDETFPDAVLGHRPGVIAAHNDYDAAKAGDDKAALRLARDVVTDAYVEAVRDALPPGTSPTIVPVIAAEAAGLNRIPLMAAKVLGDALQLPVATSILQARKVSRGGSDGLHRLANPPSFTGKVVEGQDYLILDDTLTQGGTLAELKTHIEDNGGRVLLASALTGKEYSRKIALSPESLAQVRERYSDIEQWWRDSFGHGFEGLTESEARFLLKLRGSPGPDALRARVDAARVRSVGSLGGRDDSNGQDPRALSSRAAAATGGLDLGRAQTLKQELTAQWGDDAPRVVLVDSAEGLQRAADLPASVLDDPNFYRAEGLYRGQPTVWINTGAIRTEERFAQVLAHEALGHYGVERVVGKAQWGEITDAIERHAKNGTGAADVRRAIAHVRRTQPEVESDRLAFAKEVIAVMAEQGARNGLIGRVVAAVRRFLRQVMPDMNWTDGDVRALLGQAEGFLRRGRTAEQRAALVQSYAFSRDGDEQLQAEELEVDGAFVAGLTPVERRSGPMVALARALWADMGVASPFFGDWFGASKVVDAAGQPLKVYHGTGEDFAAFDRDRAGKSTNHLTAQLGIFFDARKSKAEHYARVATNDVPAEQRIIEAHLAIRNPYVMPKAEFMGIEGTEQARALRRQLEREGHDGIQLPDVGQWVVFDPTQIKATDNRGTFDRTDDRLLFSKAAADPTGAIADIEAVMDATRTDGKLLDRARAALARAVPKKLKDAQRPTWLAALTTKHLTELGSDYFSTMRIYSDYLSEMGADRNQLATEGEALAEKARKWAGKNREESQQLFKLMHDATIQGSDPAEDYAPLQFKYGGQIREATPANVKEALAAIREQMRGRGGDNKTDMLAEAKNLRAMPAREKHRKKKHPALKERYEQLSPEAQELYREMRDMYKDRSSQVEEALVARIRDTDTPENHKRKIINVIRMQFESQRLQGVYFPLQRFGRYFVAAERAGTSTYLMFENLDQLERAVKDLRARNFTITAQGLKSGGKAKDAPSGTFVADVMQTLNKAGVSDKTQDEIYQLYLQALPELSMRKHAIHRQSVPGFDPDAVRAFAFNMHHGAHQLARLRFGHKLQDVIDVLKKQQDAERRENTGDTRKIAAGDAILDELTRRHDWISNPQDSAATNLVSSFGFVYYLGLTPAAALVNLTQTALVTYPFLAARFGPVKAMNYLLAAGRDAGRTLGNIQKTLSNPDELKAFNELVRMGAIDKTQAHNLAGIAEGGMQGYNPAWAKAMEIIGWGFHKTEVMNREASGIAAYRLARAEGQSFDEAVKFAAEAIDQTHFDYTNANRARFMQSGTAKVLLMFRQYSLNMTWHLGRMVWNATKGESAEVKRIARRNLAGLLGMSSLFSGVLGLPMAGVTMGVLNSIASSFGDDDEPWEAEVEFRAFLTDMLGPAAASVLLTGAVNELTGADIAGRVGLDQLWFRDAYKELEGRGAYYHLLEQAAGPMGGVLKNALVGKQLMDEGHLWRGVETTLPKSLKDIMKMARYAIWGVNSLRGDPLVEDLNPGQLLLQFAGFTPAEVSRQYDRNSALKNYEQHILDRRSRLMDAFAMANRTGDEEGRRETIAAIQKFNSTHPEIGITTASIRRSLLSRAKYSEKAEGGIILNRRLASKVHELVGE